MSDTTLFREIDAIHREFSLRSEVIVRHERFLYEIEERLRLVELDTLNNRHSSSVTAADVQTHHGRISYLELAVQGLIYANALLLSAKSGDIIDVLQKILIK